MAYIVFKPNKSHVLTALHPGGVRFQEWNQILSEQNLFGNIIVMLAGVALEECGFTDKNCEIYLAVIANDGSISLGERVNRSSMSI